MRNSRIARKKSISFRIQFAFIMVILLISTWFIFSIYERFIVEDCWDNELFMQEQLSLVEMIQNLLQVDDEAWGLYAFSRDILKERIP